MKTGALVPFFFLLLSHQTQALEEMRIPGSTTLKEPWPSFVNAALWNMKKIKDKNTQPSELN